MKNILREGFDFNNVISNSNFDIGIFVTDIIMNNVNVIKNIINEITSNIDYIEKIEIKIEKKDNSIFTIIEYVNDMGKSKNVIIELRCINNIVYTYISYFNKGVDVLSECVIQILNYLRNIGININDVIKFGTISSDNKFYLEPNGCRNILTFIENNYKIKLVDNRYEENDDNIGSLIIEIFSDDYDKVDEPLLYNNFINVNKNTKLSYFII